MIWLVDLRNAEQHAKALCHLGRSCKLLTDHQCSHNTSWRTVKTGRTAHHALHFLQPGKAVRLISCVIDALQRGAEGVEGTHNPITALAAASHMLLVGRSSGEVQCYTLPDLVAAGKHTLHVYSPSSLHLTCCSCLCPSDIVSANKHLLLPNPCFLQLLVLICWANCPHSAVGIISCHSHSVSKI